VEGYLQRQPCLDRQPSPEGVDDEQHHHPRADAQSGASDERSEPSPAVADFVTIITILTIFT